MPSTGKGSLLRGIDQGTPKSSDKPASADGAKKNNTKMVALAAAIGIIALCVFIVSSFLGSTDPATTSNTRVMIDSETLEVFESFRVPESGSFPYVNKKTGNKTVYPAEPCFWTRDNKAKLKPTYVLLNQYCGKTGPTICPDCGHTVTAHNKPPPGELFPQK